MASRAPRDEGRRCRFQSNRCKGVVLIRGLASNISSRDFRGSPGFLKSLGCVAFKRGLFSKFHLVVLVVSVALFPV